MERSSEGERERWGGDSAGWMTTWRFMGGEKTGEPGKVTERGAEHMVPRNPGARVCR